MTDQMLIVFGILAGAVGLFAWGRLRVDIVAILVVLSLMLSRAAMLVYRLREYCPQIGIQH